MLNAKRYPGNQNKDMTWDAIVSEVRRLWNLQMDEDQLRVIISHIYEPKGCIEASVSPTESNSVTIEDVCTKILNTDIRKLGASSAIPAATADNKITYIQEPIFCQLMKLTDLSRPTRLLNETEASSDGRLFLLSLHDGHRKFSAVEMDVCTFLSSSLEPGTKLLLGPSKTSPLCYRNGMLLLYPPNVKVLGGYVQSLVASWKAQNEVAELRACNDQLRHHRNVPPATGAPKFRPFPTKKGALAQTPPTSDGISKSVSASPPQPVPTPSTQPESVKQPTAAPVEKPRRQPPVVSLVPPKFSSQKLSPTTFTNAQQHQHRGSSRGKSVASRGRGRRKKRDNECSEYLVNPTSGGGRTLFDLVAGQLPLPQHKKTDI